MPDDWKDILLEDVADDVTVGHVGPMTQEYIASGVPFLRSQNVLRYRLDFSDTKFISSDFHDRLKKSSLSAGDVVIVRTGKPGTCAVVPGQFPAVNCSDLVIVRPGERLDSRFLMYYVNTIASHHVNSHLVGAVQQHFNVGAARKMRLHLPPLPEQKAIAGVLGALDDKIELNRRMNETLEGIARAVFRSWFIDFDPVLRNARAAGSPIPPELLAVSNVERADRAATLPDDAPATDYDHLFPATFQDSPLGPIPDGWEVKKLYEVCEFAYGKALKADNRVPGPVPVYGSNGPVGWHNERLVEGPGIVVGRKGNPGTVTWSQEDFFPIDTTFFVVPKDGAPALHYMRHALGALNLPALSADSAVPGLNRNMAYMSDLLVPDEQVIAAFTEQAEALMVKRQHNTRQTDTLAALRDTLLPKLLSGEVRVPEAMAAEEERGE
ncbi:MAG: restriction endonuclease subunit S [Phycisphaerae bacterium]